MMTKKDFIALADELNARGIDLPFQIEIALCSFMKGRNHAFNQSRWVNYLHGRCGPNGGIKK